MKRVLAILLLCPLAVSAAEWRYDGKVSGGGMMKTEEATSAEKTTTVAMEPDAAKTAVPAAMPANAPTNGMTMTKVRDSVGEPESTLAAVGDPPITRWQYPGYVVYFENDLVIISVAGHLQ